MILYRVFPSVLSVSLAFASAASAASILSPAATGRAFDSDLGTFASGSPGTEGPANVLDSNNTTKYLNTGNEHTGFIVTPSGGSSLIQSLVLTTANDVAGRDPATYWLYGTNAAITSGNNSNGLGESWTPIASGALSLPAARQTLGAAVNFTNSTSYSSYKIVFPTLKTAGLPMQVADAAFYTGGSATGTNVLTSGSSILGIDNPTPTSSYPTNESPAKAFDGDINTKYLNFGKTNAGLIVQPISGPTIVSSLEMWTANDSIERDPTTFRIWGSNDPLRSFDNDRGTGESWTLIASDTLNLPTARGVSGGLVNFANSTAYSLYKFEITGVRDANAANSFQFAELQLYSIPEPTAGLLALGACGLLVSRRRRA